jgi:putative tRNA adenosine deaminase-associated protein
VSYFAATLSRSESGWSAADLDLDAVESLDDLVELAVDALAAEDEEPDVAVVLVEQEDEWFAVVRADPDDPRVFVSDAPAALRHALGEILLPELVPDVELDDVLIVGDAMPDTADDAAPGISAAVPPVGPHDAAGDPDLLADLGVSAAALTSLAGRDGPAPGAALSTVADLLGCTAALEAVR